MAAIGDDITQRHRRDTPREGWRGAALVALSVLTLMGCVCLLLGYGLAESLPRQIDRYLLTRPGDAGLYRVTYADGSTGFLTVNVIRPNSDSLSYAAVLGQGGQAVDVSYHFTNWQGSGQPYTRVDTLARNANRLLLLAQRLPNTTVFPQPPFDAWNAGLIRSDQETPYEAQVQLYNQDWDYRAWRDGGETVVLPDGTSASADILRMEWWSSGALVDETLQWYVPGIGEVRQEERDGQGQRLMTVELVNNTRLGPEAAAGLPWTELVDSDAGEPAFFRAGPRRTGAWPTASLAGPDLRIIYRRPAGVGVTASPAYAGGLFYLADQEGRLVALDAYGAAPRWQFTAGGPITAAPAVAEGIVYVGAADKHIYALEAREGHFLWRRRVLDNVSTSPVVADGTVYVGAEDHALYALDAHTGALRWRFVAGDRLVASPALAAGRVFFGADDGVIYAVEAASGRLLWRHAMDSAVEATPAASEAGLVFVGSDNQQFAALDAASGREVWSVQTRFGYLASPSVGRDRVYAADLGGALHAYEAATGAVAWEWQDPAEAGFVSSPLLVGAHLIGINRDGRLHVWDAETGRLLHTVSVGEAVTASPTWTGEAVLVANAAGDLLALQGGPEARSLSFERRWQQDYTARDADLQASTFFADPILAGGRLYGLLRGGTLWSIDPGTGAGSMLASLGDEVWGTPAERDGVLYAVTASGQALAYELASGETRWTTGLSEATRFGPAVDDARVYVHTFGGQQTIVSALDRTTGAVLWQHGLDDGNSTPVVDGDRLYVSGTAITALEAASGEVRWESEPLVALGTLAAFNGAVYAGDGDEKGASFLAVDATTGDTLWRRDDPVHFLYGRPAYDAQTNTVLAGTQEGVLYAFAAGTGEVRWRLPVEGALQSTLQVGDGIVYATSYHGFLYAADITTGRLLNQYRPGSNLTTLAGPLLERDVMYTVYGTTLHALSVRLEGGP
jgi:outer membrane protein assembly factor BamB